MDFNEQQGAAQRNLGELLFEDWFFNSDHEAMQMCISRLDVESLQKLRAVLSPETWLAIMNNQARSAFDDVLSMAVSARTNVERAAPVLELLNWLLENGMQVLSPMLIRVGQMTLNPAV